MQVRSRSNPRNGNAERDDQADYLQARGADPERVAPQSPSTNAVKLLRQARERLRRMRMPS